MRFITVDPTVHVTESNRGELRLFQGHRSLKASIRDHFEKKRDLSRYCCENFCVDFSKHLLKFFKHFRQMNAFGSFISI